MRTPFLALSMAALTAGCVINRPLVSEQTTSTNGVTTIRTLKVTSIALWPATQAVDSQRVTLGKTFAVGQVGAEQEGGGTNVVEALRSLDSILSKIRP